MVGWLTAVKYAIGLGTCDTKVFLGNTSLTLTVIRIRHPSFFVFFEKHNIDNIMYMSVVRSAQKGNLKAVQALVHHGANLNLKEKEYGRTPLLQATLYGRLEVVRWLAAQGANIDVSNRQGFTPLHYAVWYSYMDICHLLLSKGATVDALGDEKLTPLHLAARAGHMEITKLLVHSGANVNATDNFGNTPVDWARQNGYAEVAKFLLANRSNTAVNSKKPAEKT
jgi:serine/threonine-protein phosphatase 6 regulatory ankyrin repeat subunit B